MSEAEPLVAGIAAKFVAAEHADDDGALIDTITADGIEAVISPAPNASSCATWTPTRRGAES
jgi:hypothetical protein